jgi:CHAT domain-containing protein
MSGKLAKALVLLAMGIAIFFASGRLRDSAASYYFERGVHAKQNWRLEQAIADFDQSLFYKNSNLTARFEKALCYQLRGEFLAARQELDLLLASPPQDRALQARLYDAFGVNHFNSNDADAAIESHQQSLALAKELGDKRLTAKALIGLSRALYHLKGQPDQAFANLQQGLQIARELGDEVVEADALRHIGVVLWWFKGAGDQILKDFYEPALERYRRHNNLHSAATMLSNISLIYLGKGDIFQFLKYQNESIELKGRVGDLAGLCDSYGALGDLYNNVSNYRKARDYFAKSLELSRRIGYRLAPNETEMLADIHLRLGEYAVAIPLLERLLASTPEISFQSKLYIGKLAHCYLLKNEPELARRHFEQVLEIERQIGEPDRRSTLVITMFLAESYMRLGDLDKAAELFQQTEEMSAKLHEEPRPLGHSLLLAELKERQGNRAEALRYLVEAAEMQSQRFRASGTILVAGQHRQQYDRTFTMLFDSTHRPSTVPQRSATSGQEDELAFRFLEQLRYSSFRDLVLQVSDKKTDRRLTKPAEAEALLRIKQVSERLRRHDSASLRQQLKRAYSDYEDFVMQAELAYPSYRLVREARPVDLTTVQRSLDMETALIEYFFAGDKVYALCISRTTLQRVALPVSKANLAAKIKLFRSLLFQGRVEGRPTSLEAISSEAASPDLVWQPVAEDLRRALIEPLEQAGALANVQRLGIIPFGFLHDLPFAALTRLAGERQRFLIEDYTLFHAPSATYLANSGRGSNDGAAPPALTLLSFGRDESDEPELLPLNFAVEEAQGVAQLFGGDSRVNREASETELRQLAPHFTYIHFATHAVSEPQMPLLSRLKLQGSRDDDGNLTVREILDLGLQAELVTLGACQSGQSFSSSGNEAVEIDRLGLIEAFLHAGARSVLASLLPISDRPTTEFMKSFYANLRSKSKAEALAQTQRAMLRGELFYLENGEPRYLTHPRYWTPFILVGDPR